MSDVDTSRETVGRLAAQHKHLHDTAITDTGQKRLYGNSAATLLALRAALDVAESERDKLRARVEEYKIEVSDLECEVGNRIWSFDRCAEMKESAELERDRAVAALAATRREVAAEMREQGAISGQHFVLSEGWSNTTALRLRNTLRALPLPGDDT